jgi:hypothetical protein
LLTRVTVTELDPAAPIPYFSTGNRELTVMKFNVTRDPTIILSQLTHNKQSHWQLHNQEKPASFFFPYTVSPKWIMSCEFYLYLLFYTLFKTLLFKVTIVFHFCY